MNGWVGELIERHLTDGRAKNPQLSVADLVRQSVYSRLAGYEDVNNAERVVPGPALRLIGCEKVLERGAALTSRLQSFETELLWPVWSRSIGSWSPRARPSIHRGG